MFRGDQHASSPVEQESVEISVEGKWKYSIDIYFVLSKTSKAPLTHPLWIRERYEWRLER
jgi:hypothetical protein